MSATWYIHDAGFFTLEVPPGWVAQQPNPGTLLLQDERAEIALSLVAISKAPLTPSTPPAHSHTIPVEPQVELQHWIESQRHVQIRQAPRLLPDMAFPTATTEGLQRLPSHLPWYRRALNRLRRTDSGFLLWRYWAVLNPHLLVLASCHGKPTALEKQRPIVDRLISSIQLPDHDILIGRRFTEMVVSLARSWFPQTAVDVIDDAHLQFGTQNLSLANLHRRYLASPEELPTQVRAFLTAIQGNLPASALAGSWIHARERIMPVFLTAQILHDADKALKGGIKVVCEEWINGLSIGYALEDLPLDAPGTPAGGEKSDAPTTSAPSQRIITQEDLRRWHITADELHTQALQNLVLHSHEHIMEGRRADGCTILTLAHPDRHNAARILLPELHRKLREHLGTTFYAAMPTREILLAFHITDEAVLSHMRHNVAQDFRNAYLPLSPKFFLVTPDGIAGDPADAEEPM